MFKWFKKLKRDIFSDDKIEFTELSDEESKLLHAHMKKVEDQMEHTFRSMNVSFEYMDDMFTAIKKFKKNHTTKCNGKCKGDCDVKYKS